MNECRRNARVCATNKSEIVTIAKVTPRVRNAIQPIGSDRIATARPTSGTIRKGVAPGGPPLVGNRFAIA